jgi:stringent starvation protein B
MNPDERPLKREAFLAFLRDGWVSLHLDARRAGVVVPPMFAGEPHLVLQYGRNMPIPIPDLDVSEEGVSATLSFSRAPHRTVVPWSAVYVVACTDGRGILYYEDVPQEVSLTTPNARVPGTTRIEGEDDGDGQGEDEQDPAVTSEGPAPETTMRRLRSVPADSDGGLPPGEDLESPKRRRRPQLRLVK